jgi:hypothetical protein
MISLTTNINQRKNNTMKKEKTQDASTQTKLTSLVSLSPNSHVIWQLNQRVWIAELYQGIKPDDQNNIEIATKLLAIAGKQVIIYTGEQSVMNLALVNNATLMTAEKLRIQKGNPSDCHNNCSKIWSKDPDKFSIVSGFALTADDQMWRAHTWLLDKNGVIVETTIPRYLYFGEIMDKTLSAVFAKN